MNLMMNWMRSVGNAVVREKRYLFGWNVAWVYRLRRKANSYERESEKKKMGNFASLEPIRGIDNTTLSISSVNELIRILSRGCRSQTRARASKSQGFEPSFQNLS